MRLKIWFQNNKKNIFWKYLYLYVKIKVENREERAKRIFNEVKELIMEAKNKNTFNF